MPPHDITARNARSDVPTLSLGSRRPLPGLPFLQSSVEWKECRKQAVTLVLGQPT